MNKYKQSVELKSLKTINFLILVNSYSFVHLYNRFFAPVVQKEN